MRHKWTYIDLKHWRASNAWHRHRSVFLFFFFRNSMFISLLQIYYLLSHFSFVPRSFQQKQNEKRNEPLESIVANIVAIERYQFDRCCRWLVVRWLQTMSFSKMRHRKTDCRFSAILRYMRCEIVPHKQTAI